MVLQGSLHTVLFIAKHTHAFFIYWLTRPDTTSQLEKRERIFHITRPFPFGELHFLLGKTFPLLVYNAICVVFHYSENSYD